MNVSDGNREVAADSSPAVSRGEQPSSDGEEQTTVVVIETPSSIISTLANDDYGCDS